MSGPAVIDSVKFAHRGDRINGRMAVAQMERLRDLLFDIDGSLDYAVSGGIDARGRAQLTIEVSGAVDLRCQRCLGCLPHAVKFEDRLLLGSGKDADESVCDPDAPEWMAPDPALDVAALIEDEVLLALPYAPLHETGRCMDAARAGQGAESRPKPFAALAGWKRKT